MNDKISASSLIANYRDECLFAPSKRWPKYWFKQKTYSRWAANEILKLIMDDPSTSEIVIIENFIDKMDEFYSNHKNSDNGIIFSAAIDTAKDILYLLERTRQ